MDYMQRQSKHQERNARLPQAREAPRVMGKHRSRPDKGQPRLQEGREESSRKRGTHYLRGFNMGLGNSRGIGKN